jgi:hypothetical protein
MLIALYRKRPKIGNELLPLDGASERTPVLWSEMCLKNFAMWVYKDLEVPILSSGDHLRVRARAAIITTPHFNIEDHDKYYYQQLLLYKPWYDEAELVPPGKGPLDAFVEAHAAGHLKIPASGQVDSRHTIDDLLNYVEALRFTRSKQKSVPLPNLDDPGAESGDECEESAGADARASSAAASLSKLSHQQRQMVQVVCTHDSQPQHLESPLMVLFSGEGGTGKSFVLKALVHTLNFKHGINPRDRCRSIVRVGALMGGAAYDVGGETLHHLFAFTVTKKGQKPYLPPLTADRLKELRQEWRHLKYLIIDEISMIPAHMLLWIHQRLQTFKDSRDLFGGVSVVAFGDMFQLKPPEGRYIFEDDSNFPMPVHVWRNHFLSFSLTHNFRAEVDQFEWELCSPRTRSCWRAGWESGLHSLPFDFEPTGKMSRSTTRSVSGRSSPG